MPGEALSRWAKMLSRAWARPDDRDRHGQHTVRRQVEDGNQAARHGRNDEEHRLRAEQPGKT
jgi:hypothetical protein